MFPSYSGESGSLFDIIGRAIRAIDNVTLRIKILELITGMIKSTC